MSVPACLCYHHQARRAQRDGEAIRIMKGQAVRHALRTLPLLVILYYGVTAASSLIQGQPWYTGMNTGAHIAGLFISGFVWFPVVCFNRLYRDRGEKRETDSSVTGTGEM